MFIDYQDTYVQEVCGLQVQVSFHDYGRLVARPSRDGFLRYTQARHVTATWTNIATGRAFTFVANYNNSDVTATDNGDGTVSIINQNPGSERTYGPDGKLLDVSSGNFRVLAIIDYGGTLLDQSDDTLVSETFFSGHGGGRSGGDFCEDFTTLTA
jgi:hypothetical protein